MRIHFNFSALKQTRLRDYLTRFVLGGITTVAAGVIAKEFGPIVGGLFLAFPAIFPSSATLIEKHEKEKKRRAGILITHRGRLAAALDARGTAMGTIALAAFGLFVWQLIPAHNATVTLIGAFLVWIALAVSIWRLRKLMRVALSKFKRT